MFSSQYFDSQYFSEYFKISGEVVEVELPGGGSGKRVKINQKQLNAFGLSGDDRDVFEFIVAFVLSR